MAAAGERKRSEGTGGRSASCARCGSNEVRAVVVRSVSADTVCPPATIKLFSLCHGLLVMHEQFVGEVGVVAVEPQVVELRCRIC